MVSRKRPEPAEDRPDDDMAPEGEYLVVGQVVAPRGLRGELKARIETDDPERFEDLDQIYLGEAYEPFRIKNVRLFKGSVLLQLQGIDDRDAAEAWRGEYLYVHPDDVLPLGEDEYYYHQIRGLAVRSDEGEALGHVTQVLTTGANEVYVVMGPKGELLLPAIKDVILRVDLEEGLLTVHIPEGLR